MLDLGRTNVGHWQNKCWTQGRQNVGSLSDKKLAETFRRLYQTSLTIKNYISLLTKTYSNLNFCPDYPFKITTSLKEAHWNIPTNSQHFHCIIHWYITDTSQHNCQTQLRIKWGLAQPLLVPSYYIVLYIQFPQNLPKNLIEVQKKRSR